MQLTFTGIIPARYGSSRFPGKPLALVHGLPMVVKVWENTREELENVYIATDNNEIRETAEKAGASVIMTSDKHLSGTERVFEACKKILFSNPADQVILNIQGDEPMITGKVIRQLCNAFSDTEVEIATLVNKTSDPEIINNPNRVKTILDHCGNAMYFSRSPIPFNSDKEISPEENCHFHHVGIYAFRLPVLKKISSLKPTCLEKKEKLEQLRWLENGYKIRCIETDYSGFGIDTPDDLENLNKSL